VVFCLIPPGRAQAQPPKSSTFWLWQTPSHHTARDSRCAICTIEVCPVGHSEVNVPARDVILTGLTLFFDCPLGRTFHKPRLFSTATSRIIPVIGDEVHMSTHEPSTTTITGERPALFYAADGNPPPRFRARARYPSAFSPVFTGPLAPPTANFTFNPLIPPTPAIRKHPPRRRRCCGRSPAYEHPPRPRRSK